MADTELRQRKGKANDDNKPPVDSAELLNQTKGDDDSKPGISKPKDSATLRKQAKDEDNAGSRLDILRVLTFLFLASCGLSYVISSGESFFWGMKHKPYYLKPEWWKAQFVCNYPASTLGMARNYVIQSLTSTLLTSILQGGPIYLTADELSDYNGYVQGRPLYLAVNGTIFDVSNGLNMYGVGGSYHFFAGRDASRAYVSGCFKEDLTPDMRGLEEMFLPLDDAEIDSQWTSAEMKELKARELQQAKERVHKTLKHWVDFFTNSPKYQKVGYLKRDEDWLERLPYPELCQSAKDKRKKRGPRQQD
ncbi:hypothetical protein NQ176_g2825 [Zarea fungicola]|uniref:Uncharacterized protein n=1 Tax=Zarea fungicola TaxID=93591 RepID=A0ACC1NMP6_9HYPO|nr:hypothetical protein NQ176_g2825 [Lecanicillium fungicola]